MISVAVEDLSPCETCTGTRLVLGRIGLTGDLSPCPDCCCGICGQPTDTPPECGDCAMREEDRWR